MADYTSKLARALNDLRKQSQLCDIIINIGGRPFHAHKAVLAASSSYFMSMFTSGFKESTQREVNIEGNPDAFQALLEYAYTGDMEITPKTTCDILEMACYLQFTDVSQYCCEFIKLDPQNFVPGNFSIVDAFRMFLLATDHEDLKSVKLEAMKFMCTNLKELMGSKEFLENDSESLMMEFLAFEELSNEDEEKQVLEMVVNWLKHKWHQRQPHAHSLLKLVRLGQIPEDTLIQLLDGEILSVEGCRELLDGVLTKQKSELTKVKRALLYPDLFATRSTITAPIMFAHKHDENPDDSQLCYFDQHSKNWKFLKEFKPSMHVAAVVNVEGNLYAVGGPESPETGYFDGMPDVFKYDCEQNIWSELPSLIFSRRIGRYFPMVYLDGFMYAYGGFDDSYDPIKEVECLDLVKNEWKILAPIPKIFSKVSTMSYNGKILIYGGGVDDIDYIDNNCFFVMLVYDPSTDIWHTALTVEQDTSFNNLDWEEGPDIFVHKDELYRVMYKRFPRSYSQSLVEPTVHMLRWQSLRNTIRVSVAEEISQDLIPANKLGAFRIQDDVFVNFGGLIHKTDIKINPDQSTDVVLDQWENVKDIEEQYEHCSSVTFFTFDTKKYNIA